MRIKVGDSVLYTDAHHGYSHVGIVMARRKTGCFPYEIYWINNQWTSENREELIAYREAYLEAIRK